MGKKIADVNGGGTFLPTAYMKEEGKMITGVLKSKRLADTQYGKKPVYTITVEDATCDFTQNKVPVTPPAGSDVDMFAPTRLERQLEQVDLGSKVTIINKGKRKVGRGQPAHIFDVEVH